MELEAETRVIDGRLKIPVKKKRIDLLAADRLQVAGAAGDEIVFLYGGGLMLSANRRWGGIQIFHLVRSKGAQRAVIRGPSFGPPFSWEDFFQEKADASVERTDLGITACLRSRSINILG